MPSTIEHFSAKEWNSDPRLFLTSNILCNTFVAAVLMPRGTTSCVFPQRPLRLPWLSILQCCSVSFHVSVLVRLIGIRYLRFSILPIYCLGNPLGQGCSSNYTALLILTDVKSCKAAWETTYNSKSLTSFCFGSPRQTVGSCEGLYVGFLQSQSFRAAWR